MCDSYKHKLKIKTKEQNLDKSPIKSGSETMCSGNARFMGKSIDILYVWKDIRNDSIE